MLSDAGAPAKALSQDLVAFLSDVLGAPPSAAVEGGAGCRSAQGRENAVQEATGVVIAIGL